jgi:hypothetical protein
MAGTIAPDGKRVAAVDPQGKIAIGKLFRTFLVPDGVRAED